MPRYVLSVAALLLAGCSATQNFVRVTEIGAPQASHVELAWLKLSPPPGRPPVLLLGMVHVGETAYFAEVQAVLDATPVVLMEGIVRGSADESSGAAPAPRRRIGADLFDVADALRLRHQVDELRFRAHWRKADMSEGEFRQLASRARVKFGPTLRDLQKEVNFEIFRFRRRRPALDPALAEEVVRRGAGRGLFAERILASANDPAPRPVVVVARNEIVLRALDACADDRRVAICWGFSHGPGLLAGLVRRGYTVSATTWHTAFSY